jgi:hypothetical protein
MRRLEQRRWCARGNRTLSITICSTNIILDGKNLCPHRYPLAQNWRRFGSRKPLIFIDFLASLAIRSISILRFIEEPPLGRLFEFDDRHLQRRCDPCARPFDDRCRCWAGASSRSSSVISRHTTFPSSGRACSMMLKPPPSLCGNTNPTFSQKSSWPSRRITEYARCVGCLGCSFSAMSNVPSGSVAMSCVGRRRGTHGLAARQRGASLGDVGNYCQLTPQTATVKQWGAAACPGHKAARHRSSHTSARIFRIYDPIYDLGENCLVISSQWKRGEDGGHARLNSLFP